MKNILGAYKSTLIGLAITVITGLSQALTAGPINWKVLGTSIVASILLALTDILNEQKNKA